MNIFAYERELEEKFDNSVEDLIKYAILETLIPIGDYYKAIQVLRMSIIKFKDYRLYIMGSYLSSTWEENENDFIPLLNDCVSQVDDKHKAIILYLYAYDIYMKNNKTENDKLRNCLIESIAAFDSSVYPYYLLAKDSNTNKQDAKRLMEKCLSNVSKVFSENEDSDLTDLLSFEAYINEHVLGTNLSNPNYLELKDYYLSLCE